MDKKIYFIDFYIIIAGMTGIAPNVKERSVEQVYDCIRTEDSCQWLRNILIQRRPLILEFI